MKVIVVGAGIIGASIADALAQRGADVTVVDMRGPGRGASQASAGVLAPYIEAHETSPLLDLCTRSLGMFDDYVSGVVERSGRPVEYQRTGTFEVALSDEDEARLLELRRFLTTAGIESEWLDRSAAPAFEPAVAPSARGGLLIPAHGFVRVSELIPALVESARLSGATFQSPREVLLVEPTREEVSVKAGEWRASADAVVIAAGSWSKRVRVAGVPAIDVKPVRGQLLQLGWPGPLPARVVWGPRCYTVPWPDGSVLVGATVEDVGFDERSTTEGVAALMSAVTELLPAAAAASLEAVRVGLRPASATGMPLMGPLPSAPRVHVATGHYRNGVLLAPLTAASIADGVLE